MSTRCALLVGMCLLVPSIGLAQRTTTGVIAGTVVDGNGGVLPGVNVAIKSDEALGLFTAVTDARGEFRVTNLPPATYTIRVELEGFQTVIRQEAVRLGGVTQVDVAMSIGSLSETITVQSESPLVDTERAGLSVNINNTALTTVPVTTSRRFQDVWLMVPGVYIRPDTQEATGSERRTSVDGMDVTDPFGGDIFAVNLNYEAIQDVEIKALGAEASDGASMVGQFMNVVTKSGGNTVHGSFALFVIPESFNDSNVEGIAPNNRRDIQPDMTLGGPILKDRIWYFGSYRRIQQDQTVNNAPVPRERRGNLYFVKVTSQLRPNHRLAATYQYDRSTAANAVIRGTVEPGRSFASLSTGLNSATMQITSPTAFGTRITGGPLAGANYNWVMSNTRLFQFVASWMISKPSNAEPNDGVPLAPTKIIQTNSAGNIAGSLTTIAQEGGFGAIDKADRSMLYLAPSMTFYSNRYGSHEFRGGADIYPFIRNVTSSDVQPVEYYFRPPGTTGSQDVLFERRTLRNFAGDGATINNEAYERHAAFYFQDRWKPTSSISVKAGLRVETNSIYTKDREAVLGPRLPPDFPTNTADREFHQTVGMPNVGIAWEAGKYGVFRATANRSYEWLDLGGGDGTSHAPYVLTTDVFRANPRTVAPALNETLPGQFALGVAYGDAKDGSIHNGRTYVNEFSAGWEHQLPATSSLGVTFLWRRNWDYQSGDDQNIVRDQATGALLSRPFPDFDAVRNTYNPNYTWQQNRSIQFLYTKNFVGGWGINSSYWYMISSSYRTRWNPTSDTLQFLGFTPEDAQTDWNNPRHHARLSTFVRLPWQTMFSAFYTFSTGRRFDVMTGDFPLNATAPRIVLSNGRSIADPFFNPAYQRARKRDVDMLVSDAAHLVNLRAQKTISLPGQMKMELSGDVFNLFNSDSSQAFLSVDERAANFGVPDSYVAARVAQIGVRLTF